MHFSCKTIGAALAEDLALAICILLHCNLYNWYLNKARNIKLHVSTKCMKQDCIFKFEMSPSDTQTVEQTSNKKTKTLLPVYMNIEIHHSHVNKH